MNKKLLSVFITNLGKYNEGYLIGEWVDLPTTEEELEEVFKRIGLNEQYEEYFITDYESDYNVEVGEYENIIELNEKLQDIEDYDYEKVCAMFENGEFTDLDEIINSLDDYDFKEGWTGADYEEDMVRNCYPEIAKALETGWLSSYISIDYDEIAKDDDCIIETTNGVLFRL